MDSPPQTNQLDNDDAITMRQELMEFLKTMPLDYDNDPLVW